MLWPLSREDDNDTTWIILYILPCSDRCHEMMATDGACFLSEEFISMLWPLAWDGGNWRSMFYTWMIYYHALTFVIKRWQLTQHDSCLRDILPCSICCHDAMTTDGACFIHEWYITMLWALSWDDDNWRSMNRYLEIYYRALTVVIRRSQLTEHVSYINNLLPCSDRCH